MPLQLSDIPGVARWYKSSDATANGSLQLTGWSDVSGNAQDITGVFSSNNITKQANQFGSLPGIRLVGSTSPGTMTSGLTFPRMTNARTVFVVVKGGPNLATNLTQGPLVGDSDLTQRLFENVPIATGSNKMFSPTFTNANTVMYDTTRVTIRQNGIQTLPSAMGLSIEPVVVTIQLSAGEGLDSIGKWYAPYGAGGEYVFGEVIVSTSALTNGQRDYIESELIAKYGITNTTKLRKLMIEKCDSIGYGWHGGAQCEWVAKRLNATKYAAQQSIDWDTAISGRPGETTQVSWADATNPSLSRNEMAKLLAAPRDCKIVVVSGGTNDIGSYAVGAIPNQTAAGAFLGIVNEIEFAKNNGATMILLRTVLDRRVFGSQIANQAAFDTKREALNTLIRANVYPVGHAKAGQKLADAIIDSGAQTNLYAGTLPDSTVITAGAANPMGADGAVGQSFGWPFWGNFGGASATGPDIAQGNDGIHPSTRGAQKLALDTFTVLQTVLPTSVSVSPSAPIVITTQQFTASVLPGAANQTVTWTCSAGSINSSGLFTAPAGSTVPQTVTITATSAADRSIVGTTTVTVPVAQATAFTLSGPASGAKSVVSTNFAITPTGGVYTGTITPSAGAGGGTFTPASLTWTGDAAAKTFTYTPSTVGAKTITATASPSLTAPSSVTYSSLDVTSPVLASAAINASGNVLTLAFTDADSLPLSPSTGVTGFTMSGGHTLSAGTRASSSTITFAISPHLLVGDVVTVSYSSGNVTDSATPTPNALSAISNAAVTNNSTQLPQAVSYTLAGPSSGVVGFESDNFTVTPVGGEYTGTITPSDAGQGGTFAPASLTWAAESSAKTFIYTSASVGAKVISATASPSLSAPTSVTYTSSAAPIVADPVLVGQTSFFNSSSVAITTTTVGATIRYTVDGSIPTETHGTIYSVPLTFLDTTTLKVIAYKAISISSAVVTGVYVKQEYVPGTISTEDAQVIAAAIWSYQTRNITGLAVKLVQGPFVLTTDEFGDNKIEAVAGDSRTISLYLRSDGDAPVPYSAGSLTAKLVDANGATTTGTVTDIDPDLGKLTVALAFPVRGRFRLWVTREESADDITTFGPLQIMVCPA